MGDEERRWPVRQCLPPIRVSISGENISFPSVLLNRLYRRCQSLVSGSDSFVLALIDFVSPMTSNLFFQLLSN